MSPMFYTFGLLESFNYRRRARRLARAVGDLFARSTTGRQPGAGRSSFNTTQCKLSRRDMNFFPTAITRLTSTRAQPSGDCTMSPKPPYALGMLRCTADLNNPRQRKSGSVRSSLVICTQSQLMAAARLISRKRGKVCSSGALPRRPIRGGRWRAPSGPCDSREGVKRGGRSGGGSRENAPSQRSGEHQRPLPIR